MTFCNNNDLFSNLPCPDWIAKPLQISKGGSPKRDKHFSCGAFQSRVHQLCKFIRTKESFKWQNRSSPRGMVRYTKMAVVSLFQDTKGAFDWEIWIQIIKSGFRICNRTRNPKTDLNAQISIFGFPLYRSIGKSEKGFEKLSLRTAVSCTRTHNQQEEDRCSREQLCKSFFGFPNRIVKRKSMKSGFGFLN